MPNDPTTMAPAIEKRTDEIILELFGDEVVSPETRLLVMNIFIKGIEFGFDQATEVMRS